MVDRIRKLLKQLAPKESAQLANLIELVIENNLRDLDLKKLKGLDDVYRVRKGKFRIIFRKTPTATLIIALERRSDNTYKKI